MKLFNILKRKKPRYTLEGGPGDSIENAVIIHSSNFYDGMSAEYQYLEKMCGKRYFEWSLGMTVHIKKDDRRYSIFSIKMKDGTKKSFYFDITNLMKTLNLDDLGIDKNEPLTEECPNQT